MRPVAESVRQACWQCKYFFPDQSREELGYCHRFPPAFSVTAGETPTIAWDCFPRVAQGQWCGEFKAGRSPGL